MACLIKRHELDPEKMKVAVERKIADFENIRETDKKRAVDLRAKYDADVANGTADRWGAIPPLGTDHVDERIDREIAYEKEHYGTVRILEFDQPGKRFVLVYGDKPDEEYESGTGPFATAEDAAGWFYRLGR